MTGHPVYTDADVQAASVARMTTETDRRSDLERMSDDQLQRLEDRTCYEFTGCALYLKSPERLIGDTAPRAQQLRRQHVAEAEARWFDIQAEWDRRREAGR